MRLFYFSSDSLLLIYRNTTDFRILILHPAILLNSFISFGSFVVVIVECLGVSNHNVMLAANSDSFTSSFLTSVPFIYFL